GVSPTPAHRRHAARILPGGRGAARAGAGGRDAARARRRPDRARRVVLCRAPARLLPARGRTDAMSGRLDGKVVIVTGGAAGLGLAYARRFVAEGARVVIADVADGAEALDRLKAPAATHVVRADVAVFADCQRMVEETRRRFGRVDVLVNNAAIFATLKPTHFEAIAETEWDRVMAVNVRGI